MPRQPIVVPIRGTRLVATKLEGGLGYRVGTATLPESGTGDITVNGAMYHVWMHEGMLFGARFDRTPDADTIITTGLRSKPSVSDDDLATPANESGTKLRLAGVEFPFDELLVSVPPFATGATVLASLSAASAGASVGFTDGTLTITAPRYGWTETVIGRLTTPSTPAGGRIWQYGSIGGERSYNVDLAEAYSSRGQELSTDGDRHVAVVRDQIRSLKDELASLGSRDLQAVQASDKWRRVQFLIGTQLFGVTGADAEGPNREIVSNTTGAEAFPDRLAGPYDAAAASGLLGQVLEALSSQSDLEQALKPYSGGIFTSNQHQPEATGASAAEMWDRRESQVKTFLMVTDYTRFGVWRIQNSSHMVESTETHQRASGRFAYSPLPVTTVDGASIQGFMPGGTASYSGRTAALQGTRHYQGDVTVQVTWNARDESNPARAGGLLTAEFRNLREAGTDDPLTFRRVTTAAGRNSAAVSNSYEVASIAFVNVPVGSSVRDELRFGPDQAARGMSPGVLTLRATDSSVPDISDIASEGNRPVNRGGMAIERAISGVFVGRNEFGPLGVIGHWSLDSGKLGTTPAASARGDIQIGDGTLLQGAFGAELPFASVP